MRALSIVLIALLPASAATANSHGDLYAPGAVKAQWNRLLAGGCKVAKADIATPIEARVLRNTAFAIEGKIFKSQELTELFSDDGDWYKPTTPDPKLGKPAKACVAKLKAWEAKLRKRLTLKKNIEAFITRDRRLYLDLRESVPDNGEYYTSDGGSISDGEYTWGFAHDKRCYKRGDCGGYYISCRLDDSKRKVKCDMVAAG